MAELNDIKKEVETTIRGIFSSHAENPENYHHWKKFALVLEDTMRALSKITSDTDIFTLNFYTNDSDETKENGSMEITLVKTLKEDPYKESPYVRFNVKRTGVRSPSVTSFVKHDGGGTCEETKIGFSEKIMDNCLYSYIRRWCENTLLDASNETKVKIMEVLDRAPEICKKHLPDYKIDAPEAKETMFRRSVGPYDFLDKNVISGETLHVPVVA